MTFSLNNQSAPHKHIPPTADAILVSLNWLGPGHTFRTSYAAQSDAPPRQHIITLDTKSSTATYIAPDHPFPSFDRNQQSAYIVYLPRWDEDLPGEGNQFLTVVGDVSSVDLEVLGNIGNEWHRQSQENPLTLPLDKSMDDTMLLALDVDLIDVTTGTPVMYAYLNDGTLQGWQLKHSKPYIGMVSAQGLTVKPSSGFGAFGNVSSGVFGSTSSSGGAFSNLNSGTTNFFGQGSFGASNVNSGNISTPQPSDMTREVSMSDSTGGFGGMSLGSPSSTNSNAVNSMFGSFSAAPVSAPAQSAFGGIIQPATGFGAFNSLKPSNNFEPSKPATTTSAFSAASQASTSSGFGQSGFASPAFGKSSFGQPAFGKPGLGIAPSTSASGFAAFANTPATFGSSLVPAKVSGFGSPEIKAASSGNAGGFNAFASGTPATFGSALEANKSTDDNKDSGGAFASTAPTTFASNFGAVNIPKVSGGGFGAFAATAPAGFGTTPVAPTTLENTPLKASEGEARTSVFGTPTESKSFALTAESPFASPTIKSTSFGDLLRNTTNTPGGSPQSAFAISPPSSPEPGVRTSSSPYTNAGNNTPSTPPRVPPVPGSNAFSNIQATPSAFKPMAGFGAFGSGVTPSTSPFFRKPDDKPPVSAFSNLLPQAASSTTPVSTPTFGSPSALGGPKSVFAPVSPPSPTVLKPTTSDGFGAFSGSIGGGFSAFAGPKKSFSELLKTGDPDPVKPSTPLAFWTPSSKDLPEEKTTPKAFTPITTSISIPSDSNNKKEDDAKNDKQKSPKSVFSALSAPSLEKESVDKREGGSNAAVLVDDDKKPPPTHISSGSVSDEPSYGTVSGLSTASSFVDVKADEEFDGDAEEDDDDEGDDGVNAFLSEDASSDGSYEAQDSAEESSAAESSEAKDSSPPPEPAAISLPISRSPSTTPQPEVPAIEVSPSPPSEEKSYRPSSLSPSREPSTTPPGTPTRESKPLIGSSSSPSGSGQAITSPFGIGLGRPSTRPTRSSPLANAVLSGHDDEDEDKIKPPQPPPAAPKPVFNTLPVKPETESLEGQSLNDKRPKTPPLLSTIAGSSFFAPTSSNDMLKPSTVPVGSSPAKMKTPASLPFSFQSPAATTPSPSLSGKAQPIPDIQRPASAPTPTHPTLVGTPLLVSATSPPNASVFNKIPPVNPQTLTTTISRPNFFGTPPSVSATSAPNASAFNNIPSVNPQALTTTTSLPSAFSQAPKSTSGPSMGLPSLFASQSQTTPSSQSATLKTPPADLFALSPAFSTPKISPAATAAQIALEEGMQKECVYSVTSADKELEEVSISNSSLRVLHI